ncbi:MAG: HAD superfamily hydrolase (TIGR01509 family) [Crocinitomicaceae bacterium]|jgi:HAD superfamily hydrolase (TIGR01509 family)
MININNFDAVIFDMDGVLIDSEPLWKIAMEEVFASVGCQLTREDFQKTVGLRIDEVIEFWYAEVGWENATAKDVEEAIVSRMVELIQANGDPLMGVLETIEFLKSNKIKIGLATSSYTVLIDAVLTTLGIQDSFDEVHSAENEEFGKPHPAVYMTTAKRLNVDPMRCLVIEDSLNGVISGKAAKMKVVCIPEKTHHPEPKLGFADFMFEDMSLFLKAIDI